MPATLVHDYGIDDAREANISYDDFHKALIRGEWSKVERFLDDPECPTSVTDIINNLNENSLHVAACYGHNHIIEKLIDNYLSPRKNVANEVLCEILEQRQKAGHTVLSLAAVAGNIPMAKYLVRKNPNLPRVKSAHGDKLPVLLALYGGQIDMARYLYGKTYLADLREYNCSPGVEVLGLFILSKNFDIASNLVKRSRELIISENFAMTCPMVLAMCKSAFPSGTPLWVWQKLIYRCIPSSALRQSTVGTNENGESDLIGGEWYNNSPKSLLCRIRSYLLELFGVKKMYELKLMHFNSKQFLEQTLKLLREEGRRVLAWEIAKQAMIKAVEEGNVEFIIALFKAIPEIVRSIDHRGRTVFSYAVECRQAEIFSLIHGFPILKHDMAPLVDDQGDNMLHMAGKLAPPSHFSHISGAALQMQRELQWFKKVESTLENNTVVKDYFKNWKTKRPREYFTENHKQLAIDGEKWMKEIATSCIFVSALIVTVTFAAAFVVPGGTEADGPRSLRAISHQDEFRIFMITDAISLFFSTTSVLIFLGILTSSYYEDAFLKLLPTKLIVGFVTLFISIVAMMIAFCFSLDMMLQGQFFILIPVVLLGAMVILFLNQQWPILVEIFVSTYGRGIFTRKYDNWMLEE